MSLDSYFEEEERKSDEAAGKGKLLQVRVELR
jgi:hypothetical protein